MLGGEHTVFVYGTLRRNESNHSYLQKAKEVATQCFVQGALYDTGCGYPAMLEKPDCRVYGELYQVNALELTALDALEGYHGEGKDNLYRRVRRAVYTDRGPVEAFVYIWAKDEDVLGEQIDSGDWKWARLLGKDGLNSELELFYLAYASAMDDQRFKGHGVAEWFSDVVGKGVLPGFSLRFTRKSSDGGRADIVEIGGCVEGKVYKVGAEAVDYLYSREGVPVNIYRPAFVDVEIDGKTVPDALTFVVVNKDEETAPPQAYVSEILRGGKGTVSDAYLAELIAYLQNTFDSQIDVDHDGSKSSF